MEQVLAFILTYKYTGVFLFSLFEAPVVSIVGGFLITLKVLNPFIVLLLAVLGDFIGDLALYAFGRWGWHTAKRYGYSFGVTEAKQERAARYFEENHRKAIVISKLTHGIGFTGLIVAGAMKVPYRRYIAVCIPVAAAQAAVLMLVGYLLGHAYLEAAKYLDYFALIASAVAIAVILYFWYRKRNSFVATHEPPA